MPIGTLMSSVENVTDAQTRGQDGDLGLGSGRAVLGDDLCGDRGAKDERGAERRVKEGNARLEHESSKDAIGGERTETVNSGPIPKGSLSMIK